MARDDDDDDNDSGDPWDLVDAGWRGLKEFFGDNRTEEEKERSSEIAFQNRLAEEERWNDTSGDSDYISSGSTYRPYTDREISRIEREQAFVDSIFGKIWIAVTESCFGQFIGIIIKITLVLIILGLLAMICNQCMGI